MTLFFPTPKSFPPESLQHDVSFTEALLQSHNFLFHRSRKCPECPGRWDLVSDSRAGEKQLSVVGAKERDFLFYGCSHLGHPIEFIESVIHEHQSDVIKFPLVGEQLGNVLVSSLASRLSRYRFHLNLSTLSPVAERSSELLSRISACHLSIHKKNWDVLTGNMAMQYPRLFDWIKDAHYKRWGRNRPETYFTGFLSTLASNPMARPYLLLDEHQSPIAFRVNLQTGPVTHCYYHIRTAAHAGRLLTEFSMHEAFSNPHVTEFSFGRGVELYKFNYSTRVENVFEVVGMRSGA